MAPLRPEAMGIEAPDPACARPVAPAMEEGDSAPCGWSPPPGALQAAQLRANSRAIRPRAGVLSLCRVMSVLIRRSLPAPTESAPGT